MTPIPATLWAVWVVDPDGHLISLLGTFDHPELVANEMSAFDETARLRGGHVRVVAYDARGDVTNQLRSEQIG